MRIKCLFAVLAVAVTSVVWADEPVQPAAAPEAAPAIPGWTAVGWLDMARGQDPLAVLDVYNAQGWELLFINFPVGAHQTSFREVALGKTWPVVADDKGVVLAGGYLDRWLFCDQNYLVGRAYLDRQVGGGWRAVVDNVIYVPVSGGGSWAYYNPQSSLTHPISKKLSGGLATTIWDAEGILGGDFARIGPIVQYDLGGGKSAAFIWWRDIANDMPDAFRVRLDVSF